MPGNYLIICLPTFAMIVKMAVCATICGNLAIFLPLILGEINFGRLEKVKNL